MASFSEVVGMFMEFLEISFHTYLYHKGVYPADVFKKFQRYRVPVYFSTSTVLQEYIQDLITSVKELVLARKVERVGIVLSYLDLPLESLIFEILFDFNRSDALDFQELESSFRACILKLSLSQSTKTGVSWHPVLYSTDLNCDPMKWLVKDARENEVGGRLEPLKSINQGYFHLQVFKEAALEQDLA